jgi:beta-N-acetylhexosaminidase
VILPGVIEKLTGEKYEKYLRERLYSRLGTTTLMYNPWGRVEKDNIAPTENDKTFRHEQLQGFVHDETAAMMGGISGNAGLFGSAGDVAKVMQLYLQDGKYGDEQFISPGTLQNWTSSHRGKTINRRGYGFDKPGIQNSRYKGKSRYPSTVVSEESYGHSGYTGTFTWADPVNDMLFVFLSNRVYPDRNNHKINKLNLRQQILDNAFKLVGNLPDVEH